MEIYEFGTAPEATAKGYVMTQVVTATVEELRSKHANEDLIFVRGAAVVAKGNGVFEFAQFEPMKPLSITLYNQNNGSDKVYQATLHQRDGGWVVDYANGRRGKALTTGTKIETPVDFKAAKKVFDDLVKSKIKGGYTPDVSGIAYTNTEHEKRASGIFPRLPTALQESEVCTYVDDYRWFAQEKKDGENRTLLIQDGCVRGINRKGLFVDIPQEWVERFSDFGHAVIAGEQVGGMFYAFDLLELAGCNLRKRPFSYRLAALSRLIKAPGSHQEFIQMIPAYSLSEDKLALIDLLKLNNGEGVVFHEADAPFESGRSLTARKFKFVESSSFLVLRHNVQRSVALGLLDHAGKIVELGNVTIPENHEIPAVDQVVEVRYLYRFEDGYLEQPVYLGPRSDIDKTEAVLSQITRIKSKSLVA